MANFLLRISVVYCFFKSLVDDIKGVILLTKQFVEEFVLIVVCCQAWYWWYVATKYDELEHRCVVDVKVYIDQNYPWRFTLQGWE